MALQTSTPRPAFGRRITQQAQAVAPKPLARVAEPVAEPAPAVLATNVPQDVSVDHELQAWKETRGSQFKIPWRQLYLMASLCFGIASFVLPDSVNENVDYLLWGLSAMSAYAWYTGRKKKVKDSAVP
jgi:hypothetical protein